MISRRLLVSHALLFLAGCQFVRSTQPGTFEQLTVGVIAHGEEALSIERYQRFIEYLQSETKILFQLEPVYNEIRAIEQIKRQIWSLVFAPPGLAAIAVSEAQYLPMFPLQDVENLTSVLVTLEDSPIQELTDVNGQIIALGQPGSATGYYVPLYELYGTAPAEVRVAPTPRTILEWLANREVVVGAMAKDQLDRHRSEFSAANFRILRTSRRIPPGSVLVSPQVDRNQQELLHKVMSEVFPTIAQEAGYVPNASPPDYETLISFIRKVEPIEARIREKPAPLYAAEEEELQE
jgi:phosphonate transport system substrate-binding protein